MLRVWFLTTRIRLSISQTGKQCKAQSTDAGRVLCSPQERLELRPVKRPSQLAARRILHDRDPDAILLHQTQVIGDIHRLKNMPALL